MIGMVQIWKVITFNDTGGKCDHFSEKFQKPNETIDFTAKNCTDMFMKYLVIFL